MPTEKEQARWDKERMSAVHRQYEIDRLAQRIAMELVASREKEFNEHHHRSD